jgi:hypothetical protein
MGGEACDPSGRWRPGQAAAEVEVLGDVAGDGAGGVMRIRVLLS